jgi:hypothetical protein
MATKCITDWVAPGKGDTVADIAALCRDEIPADDRRTDLKIVSHGRVTDYDERRAEVALARMGV